jgi:glycosyltransferase involved in cell wall biosynthesis
MPVIGSNSGEIPHVVGDAGVIVPEGDASSLAAAMRHLYDHPTERRKLGAKARARVEERFTQARVARQTYTVYQDIIGSSK